MPDHGMQHPREFASTLKPPRSGDVYDKLTALTLAQQPSAGFGRQEIIAVFERLLDFPSSMSVNAPRHKRHNSVSLKDG